MKVENVFDIYQNSSLGALLLNEFVISYERINKDKQSPRIERVLPVLPILFTKDIVTSAKGRSNNIKGFYNVLEDNKLLFDIIPLKTRSMFDKTMFSLLICIKANLLDIDFSSNIISSNIDSPKQKFSPPSIEIGDLVRTARKLGGWFSNLSDVEFLMYLNLDI
ncbi:hypothetical protein SAMN04488511_11953 [Pedobacter suwonensis]|uniref:Uncharacterized protein n=1 Tax=Pedobacter suwonensis TaxID=332999 RepID=A0A1I0U340_9SPHI|nr:three component ABC system middle component [Pedobacter suwonensis]SFA58444.1 hypothetical protein SAMN04488511_11953 [Pedobacter suwonensis]